MNLELHTLALRIFKICYEHNIHLDTEWVPRDHNARADFISKLVDFDDWQVTEVVLKDLDGLWGPIQRNVLPCISTKKSPDIFRDFGTRKRRGSMHLMQLWEVAKSHVVDF